MSRKSSLCFAFAIVVLVALMESGCSDADVISGKDYINTGHSGNEDTSRSPLVMNINPYTPHSMNAGY